MGRPKLFFAIQNESKNTVEIGPEHISTSIQGRGLHVYTHQELLAEENRLWFLNGGLLFLCTLTNSAVLAVSNDFNLFAVNYLPVFLMAGQARIHHEGVIDELTKNYLKKNTLLPGHAITSRVEFNCPYPMERVLDLEVSLDVGPDHHQFYLEVDRLR
jgi:hypothetical protein